MKAIVALGSNLGDRFLYLRLGTKALEVLGKVTPSPMIMETPDESGQGPAYLNTVVQLETGQSDVRRLLEHLLRIELELGRDRTKGPNAPRTLDLDLIEVQGVMGVFRWKSPADLEAFFPELLLELPHPRAAGRAFVMEPLKALRERGDLL